MAEINNNIPNFGFKKVEIKQSPEQQDTVQQPAAENTAEQTYTPDPGVLGRSQVKRSTGANIAKTVEETYNIATKQPAVMCCGEGVFDSVYKDLIEGGMNESDAYMRALMAEEEFLGICPHN